MWILGIRLTLDIEKLNSASDDYPTRENEHCAAAAVSVAGTAVAVVVADDGTVMLIVVDIQLYFALA